MGNTNFESDEDKELYIAQVTAETKQLEIKAKQAHTFQRMYDSSDFQEVMVNGLLGEYMIEQAAKLVDPQTTEKLEEEILIELKLLKYLNKFIERKLLDVPNADRLVVDNNKLLLELQQPSTDEDR